MKRLLALFGVAVMFICSFSGFTVLAAEADSGEPKLPSNVTITVVMPDKPAAPEKPAPDAPASPAFIKVYPSDVTDIRNDGGWQIIKTYELNADESPNDIPRDSFERSGWTFTLTDIIRRETANAETRAHTETVTVNTDTKELEKILPLLAPTMEYKADDGFVGILSLDVASIKVETAGTKTSSYTMSVTREYPHLSDSDTELVPKTVTDKGSTYHLAGVEWKVGNYSTVDYERIPDYYTAIATYTATGTSTKVTGYVTTAVYNGTLAKLSQGKTVYTAYFLGEEIRTPLEMTEPTPGQAGTSEASSEPTSEPATATPDPTAEPTIAPSETPSEDGKTNNAGTSGLGAWLAIIPLAAVFAGGAYYFMKKRGNHNAKTHHPDAGAADAGGDGGSGAGG
jgi:hypothetical protein